ncbi:COX15/CtaA family protein [Nannocystaceae bacterium ST9]
MPDADRRFANYAWIVLAYTFAVIVFGAWVRITGSGAGCGQHWPTCHGEVVHLPETIETTIELTHRVTSGLSLLMAIGLLIWGLARYPRPHLVRWGVVLAMVFMLLEALIGAGLVLLELVGRNDSISRAIVMAIHLSNTCLLTGAMTVAAWAAPGRQALRWRGNASLLLVGALIGIVLVSMSGAVTALGDTLYPVSPLDGELPLAERMARESTSAHFLQRMRVVHPLMAVGVGLYLLWLAIALPLQPQAERLRKLGNACAGLVVAQLCAGVVNIMLSAPGWMQLVHLALATAVWIAFVLLLLESSASGVNEAGSATA